MVLLVLYLVGRPLATDDLWFHLKMGEAFATEGLWPDADPMLHTAVAEAPIQHEWLFQVFVYEVWQSLGFYGLRAVHVPIVAGIFWLIFAVVRRESRSSAVACFGVALFVVLAWYRLFQFRPDLASIPAAYGLYLLLLEREEPPSWKAVGGASLLLLAWSNAHSLFGVGILLLVAALLGFALKALLLAWVKAAAGEGPESVKAVEEARARNATYAQRLAAALVCGVVITLLNPRGVAQHLTFFSSSSESAIWLISDEWRNFRPLAFASTHPSVSLLARISMDALIAAFSLVALWGVSSFLRRRSLATLARIDPPLLALGAASLAAAFISVRFFWMGIFPLLFALRALRVASLARPALWSATTWVLSVSSLCLLLAFPGAGGYTGRGLRTPWTLSEYMAVAIDKRRYYADGVEFLANTDVAGKLFNVYHVGAFAGFLLAPRIRTFVDGRTEHYPPEVLDDLDVILQQMGRLPGETYLDVLDRRDVNIFFGVGIPAGEGRVTQKHYSVTLLERASPDRWILVSRSIRHAIYLRAGERSQANLARVARYYEEQGVPFSKERGLDVGEVLRERPDWAKANGMLPASYEAMLAEAESEDPRVRYAALNDLGILYALLGLYEDQIAADRRAAALREDAAPPRRRLVFAHLRLDRVRAGLQAAEELVRLNPEDRDSREVLEMARQYAQLRAAERSGKDPGRLAESRLNRFALFRFSELRRFFQRF